MFQLLRRVSGSLLPRPDRPWSDDATSHAPTIGRKRRYSITEQDVDGPGASTAKRTKDSLVKSDTEQDTSSEGESPEEGPISSVKGQEVKAVTKGVEEVDLEDKDEVKDTLSIRPEVIPLPDSPSASPEPDSESPEPANSNVVDETNDREHVDDKDSVASSAPEDDGDEDAEAEPDPDAFADEIVQAQGTTIAVVESGLHGVPEALEVKS